MRKGGVIFDFNGTLFWDSAYQESSWDEYLAKHDIVLTQQDKKDHIHGRNSKDSFEFLFNRKFSLHETEILTEEKEILYRAECLKHDMVLAPGATELLEYLRTREIPMAIATASGGKNVKFFIENLPLSDYFSEDDIIYNDGTIKGKPDPDLFLKAIDHLGIQNDKTIIFEDSVSGIKAAQNSNPGAVIIVNSVNGDYSGFNLSVINHFNEFDRNLIDQICL